jgi:hypothetical protein
MAYGSEGHRAIGEAARTLLNARAKAHIAQILGSDDLAAVSTWADDVRAASRGYGPLVDNAEAARFNAEFPGNAGWHFADIPLGESDYTDNDPFSKSMDVVHVINLCIRSLEGDSSALKGATRNQALDLLVHFVGDVHQPLHVGEGFYRLDDPNSPILIQDPHQATGLPDDRGGNALYFTRSKELHAMWDTDLVADACGSTDSHVLARAVEADVARHRVKTPGDYHRWAEAWASDSLAAARGAYAGITFGPATVEKRGRIRRIEITLPPDYEKEQSKTVLRELSKAAWRLADLLNAIAWK